MKSVDVDESAAMLMLLGELGGAGDSSEEEAEQEDGGGGRGGGRGTVKGGRGGKKGGINANGAGASGSGAGAANADADPVDPNAASGPVGEWLKAEGEARMKMADHRRLIYRWTNAIYRLLGMKIPRGMGSLFDKGEKNKREKFDRFLSYYYGTETFEPGTYWYNNADTIQFFIELVRVATDDRYTPEPVTIQRLFRKKDPTRQASTWIMVKEELEKTDVSADELRALFQGEPRVTAQGFPRGRPLFVPIPKNPKGHHKYTTGSGAVGTPGPSPHGGKGNGGSKRGGANRQQGSLKNTPRGGAGAVSGRGSPQVPVGGFDGVNNLHLHAQQNASLAAAQAAMAAFLPNTGGGAQNLNQQHALAQRAMLAARFGLTETQLGSLSALGGMGGGMDMGMSINQKDSSTAAAMNAAHRHAVVTAAVVNSRGFVLGQQDGVRAADFSAVAVAQAAAAASAPGACDRVTLPPPSPGRDFLHAFGAVSPRKGSAFGLKRLGSRVESGASRGTPVRRLDGGESDLSPSTVTSPSVPPPTRLVGDVWMGSLGDVFGPVFGKAITFEDEGEEGVTPSDAAKIGRERILNLGEEIHKVLPVVDGSDVAGAEGGGGGRGTREPTVDRTAFGAEADSVLVAAKAAESAWRRHQEALSKIEKVERELSHLRNDFESASCDLQGARLAMEANAGIIDPMIRTVMEKNISERVEKAEAKANACEKVFRDAETEANDARAVLATSARAHKPTYEEVRKRALRIRLAAEERCERQIARAASRAERDVAAKRTRVKKESKASEGDDSSEKNSKQLADARTFLEIAEAALTVIHQAAEGCKTATEWSRVEISKISSGRDV